MPAAARAFAFDEPNFQAGVYRDVLLRRWRNLLGATMWQRPAYGCSGSGRAPQPISPCRDPDRLIAHGPLLSDDGPAWLGTAALVTAADRELARAVLTAERYTHVEVHDWTFGGRR